MSPPNFSVPEVLILGCGNPLYGDDGFGPAVVKYLKEHVLIPDKVEVMEVGTRLIEVLLELALSETRPSRLIIVDAVKMPGQPPGQVWELDLGALCSSDASDLSVHQFPSAELLRAFMEETGVTLHLVVAQGEHFPRTPEPGLSEALTAALPQASRRIMALL